MAENEIYFVATSARANKMRALCCIALRCRKMPLLLFRGADAIAVDDGVVLRDLEKRIVELFFGDVRHFAACNHFAI